ncbi:MAG TPA: hypothetical protein VFW73_04640 [Lacipirellulaceae bacterium]|nr:hypothetical protein [Lacipirellulaceae bacterium]
MNKTTRQELLSPEHFGFEHFSGWFDWLIDPLPKRFMLPATGLWIMGLDWFLFSEEAASFGLAIPFTSVVGFLAGGIGTYYLQTRHGLDSPPVAMLKALAAGILVGVPFPLAGTLAGAWILANSGIASVKSRILSARLVGRHR